MNTYDVVMLSKAAMAKYIPEREKKGFEVCLIHVLRIIDSKKATPSLCFTADKRFRPNEN